MQWNKEGGSRYLSKEEDGGGSGGGGGGRREEDEGRRVVTGRGVEREPPHLEWLCVR